MQRNIQNAETEIRTSLNRTSMQRCNAAACAACADAALRRWSTPHPQLTRAHLPDLSRPLVRLEVVDGDVHCLAVDEGVQRGQHGLRVKGIWGWGEEERGKGEGSGCRRQGCARPDAINEDQETTGGMGERS